jgi:hypothetical protein
MMGKKKGSLDCITWIMKTGPKFTTKTWWKCILSTTTNSISKLLPIGNTACMGLSMDTIMPSLIIFMGKIPFYVLNVCVTFLT